MTIQGAVLLVVLSAAAALAAHTRLAVFNDGVRSTVRTTAAKAEGRVAVARQARDLAAPSVLGFGGAVSALSGLLNPFLLLLPADVVGLRSTRRWVAAALGAAWGAVAVGLTLGAHELLESASYSPVPHLGLLARALVLLFDFFPAIAAAQQFGRVRGALVFVVVLLTTLVVPHLPDGHRFAWLPLLLGAAAHLVLVLVAGGRGDAAGTEAQPPANPFAAIQADNAARLRRGMPLLAVLGALLAAVCNMRVFAGSEVSAFLLGQGLVGDAARLDAFRALGYVPLIVMVALAAGTYAAAGLTLVYAVGYLAPNLPTAVVAGGLVIVVEVLALPRLNRQLMHRPYLRVAADHLRNSIYTTLELGLLVGSLLVALRAGGALGFALVGGLFLVNEAMGRPVIRMAAAPTALIVATALLEVAAPETLPALLGLS